MCIDAAGCAEGAAPRRGARGGPLALGWLCVVRASLASSRHCGCWQNTVARSPPDSSPIINTSRPTRVFSPRVDPQPPTRNCAEVQRRTSGLTGGDGATKKWHGKAGGCAQAYGFGAATAAAPPGARTRIVPDARLRWRCKVGPRDADTRDSYKVGFVKN